MQITLENTRSLFAGETVLPDDFYCAWTGPRRGLSAVEKPEVGKVLSEKEEGTYRRRIGSCPYENMEVELGLESVDSKRLMRYLLNSVKEYEKQTNKQ